jgi:hypothetical protein
VSANAAGTGSGNLASTTSHRIDTPQRLISRDGRYVVFASLATDLGGVPDANGASDIFIHDLTPPGTTELVSVNAAGTAAANGHSISHSISPTISDDGRFVCFVSTAGNLAPGVTDNNGVEDVYVRDLQTSVTTLVSVTATFTRGGEVYPVKLFLLGATQYFAIFDLPTNTTLLAQSYRIEVVATDAAGNRASLNGGSLTLLAATREHNRPQIPHCLISPRSLPATGGEVTVLLVIVDDSPIERLSAGFRLRGTAAATEVTLMQVEIGQPFYRGMFTAPANGTAEPQEYGLSVFAMDRWRNFTTASFGTLTVAPAAP